MVHKCAKAEEYSSMCLITNNRDLSAMDGVRRTSRLDILSFYNNEKLIFPSYIFLYI